MSVLRNIASITAVVDIQIYTVGISINVVKVHWVAVVKGFVRGVIPGNTDRVTRGPHRGNYV